MFYYSLKIMFMSILMMCDCHTSSKYLTKSKQNIKLKMMILSGRNINAISSKVKQLKQTLALECIMSLQIRLIASIKRQSHQSLREPATKLVITVKDEWTLNTS